MTIDAGRDSVRSARDARVGGVGFRPDIEGLRAVAVALVALCHAHVPGLEGGFIGVDVFYVISGFLITLLLLRSREQHSVGLLFRDFYARRVRRLVPAATLTVSVSGA